jgi:hypothetical protein
LLGIAWLDFVGNLPSGNGVFVANRRCGEGGAGIAIQRTAPTPQQARHSQYACRIRRLYQLTKLRAAG